MQITDTTCISEVLLHYVHIKCTYKIYIMQLDIMLVVFVHLHIISCNVDEDFRLMFGICWLLPLLKLYFIQFNFVLLLSGQNSFIRIPT